MKTRNKCRLSEITLERIRMLVIVERSGQTILDDPELIEHYIETDTTTMMRWADGVWRTDGVSSTIVEVHLRP